MWMARRPRPPRWSRAATLSCRERCMSRLGFVGKGEKGERVSGWLHALRAIHNRTRFMFGWCISKCASHTGCFDHVTCYVMLHLYRLNQDKLHQVQNGQALSYNFLRSHPSIPGHKHKSFLVRHQMVVGNCTPSRAPVSTTASSQSRPVRPMPLHILPSLIPQTPAVISPPVEPYRKKSSRCWPF